MINKINSFCRLNTILRDISLCAFPTCQVFLQNAYQKHKEVLAAQGVKIIAKDLDHALAGLPMHVAKKPDEVDVYKV